MSNRKTWSLYIRSYDAYSVVNGVYSFNLNIPDCAGRKLKVSVKDFVVSRALPLVQGAVGAHQADSIFCLCSNLHVTNNFDSRYGYGNSSTLATVHYTQPFFTGQSPVEMEIGNVNGFFNFWVQDITCIVYRDNTVFDSWILNLVVIAE